MIESINLMLVAIDPTAKQCMPIYVVIFILSDFYGPSFKSANRVVLNTMYRLGDIYKNSAEINRQVFSFIYDKTLAGEDKTITNYLEESTHIGQLTGLQFKMIMYVKEFDDPTQDLYSYPEVEVEIPEFDALIYPNGTVGEEYPDYIIFWVHKILCCIVAFYCSKSMI